MVAHVKGPLFYFPQMFPNLCVQIYTFGLCLEVLHAHRVLLSEMSEVTFFRLQLRYCSTL